MARNVDHLKQFQFKKGKSGNPKGRPKKFFSKVLSEIKRHGDVVDANAVQEVYQVMMSLSEDQIKEIVKDKDLPMMYRIIGKRMLAKDGFEVIERMMDRANGKPKITQEISSLNANVEVNLPEVSDEVRAAFDRVIKKADNSDA